MGSYKEQSSIKFGMGLLDLYTNSQLDKYTPEFLDENNQWLSIRLYTKVPAKCFRLEKDDWTFEPLFNGKIEVSRMGRNFYTWTFTKALDWLKDEEFEIKTGYELEQALSNGFKEFILLVREYFGEKHWIDSFEIIHTNGDKTDIHFCQPNNVVRIDYLPSQLSFVNNNNLIRVSIEGQTMPLVYDDANLAIGLLEASMLHFMNLQNVQS